MQNEISGQNGPKDMVSFSFEVIFNLYTIITTVTVHYIRGLTGQATLKPYHPLYTWCTMVRSLWHVESNIWNLLAQTACLYTSCKWGKRVLKMIVCIPCKDRCIRDFCTRRYLLLVYINFSCTQATDSYTCVEISNIAIFARNAHYHF